MLTEKVRAAIAGGMLTAALLFVTTFSSATLVHNLDAAGLTESSDLIICGLVISVNNQGPTEIIAAGQSFSAAKMVATIRVYEVLKGTIETPTVSVEFSSPSFPSGIRVIPDDQFGMFFLQKNGINLHLSDPLYPFLPAKSSGRSTSGLPLDRVIARLLEVLRDHNSLTTDSSSSLEALASIQEKAGTQALREAMQSSTGDLQLLVAAKLLARNDISGLNLIEEQILHPVPSRSYLLPKLAGSLIGVRDPKSIPVLDHLLHSSDPLVIRAVAIALRQTGSADAEKPLSKLLESDDERVRYYAVIGLGEITHEDEWAPAFSEFLEHESKYLSYWRDWTASNLPSAGPN